MKQWFLLLLLLTIPLVDASYMCRKDVNCTRVDKIMKNINLSDYNKNIDFVNYNNENYYGMFTFTYTIFHNNKTQINNYKITIYKNAYSLSDENLKCVLYHELGHYKEMKNGSRAEKLSEEYANKYGCEIK